MKNVKTILIWLTRSFRLRTGSCQEDPTNGKPVFITLEEARKDVALVKEMSEQINEASIITGTEKEYMAGIIYKGQQFYISGKHSEWMAFYGMEDS